MSSKAVKAHARSKNGDELTVHAQSSDSPLLPVTQLNELHQFRPDLVDFVVQQTKLEAEHRRQQTARINVFVFIERILGMLMAAAVGAMGVGGGIYLGLNGQPILGGTVATVTVGSLAVAYLHKVITAPKQ